MKKLYFLSLFFLSQATWAQLRVVSTLPDITEIVKAVGGEYVQVESLLNGNEDPHFAEARPSYVLKLRNADLVCSIGMELEDAWLKKSLERSGNKKAQDIDNRCVLGSSIDAVDIPAGVVNRSMGDVHAHGNPHFLISPVQLQKVSLYIAQNLSRLQPVHKDTFQSNAEAFNKRIENLYQELKKDLKPVKVMEYHKHFTYFFNDYSLDSQGSLEEKPGMPPATKRIAEAALMAKKEGVKVLFATTSAPHKTLERFTELSGVPVVIVPSYVQSFKNSEAPSIEALQRLLRKSIPNDAP